MALNPGTKEPAPLDSGSDSSEDSDSGSDSESDSDSESEEPVQLTISICGSLIMIERN